MTRGGEHERERAGVGRLATSLLVALAGSSIALFPFVVPAAGWATLYLSAAVRGTDAAWQSLVEATPGTVIAYGLSVILLPLLAQPFFMAIAIVTLIAAGIAGRIASKITCRLVVARLSSTLRQRLNRALRPLLCLVNLRLLVAARPEVAESLRFLIRVLDHEAPSRPYRAVLSLVVAPIYFAALATASCVAMLAMAYPGSPWISPLLSLLADAIGYAGVGVFVATLAVLAVPFSGENLLPRVTDWKGALFSVAVLYAFMTLSGFVSVVA